MFSQLIEGFMGGFIPLFYSYKAIKRGTKGSLVRWLKYWVVYAAFHVVTFFLELLLLSHFIPFYGMFKTMFLIWCVNPYTSGAQFMYDKVLRSMISRYERRAGKQIAVFISSIMDWTPLFFSQNPSPFYQGREEASEVESDNDDTPNCIPRRKSFVNSPPPLVYDPRLVKQESLQEYSHGEDNFLYESGSMRSPFNSSRGDISDLVETTADETTSEDDVSLRPPTLRRSARSSAKKEKPLSDARNRNPNRRGTGTSRTKTINH